MKTSISVFPSVAFLLLPALVLARDIAQATPNYNHYNIEATAPREELEKEMAKPDSYQIRSRATGLRMPDTVQVAGSSLPDCSHACEPCNPCRLVMVSFVCASLIEPETCPVSYKCLCNSKTYPVP